MMSSHAQRTVTPFRRVLRGPVLSRFTHELLFSIALLKARAAEFRRSLWISRALEMRRGFVMAEIQ